MKASALLKIIGLLTVFNVTGCNILEKEPATFEFNLLNSAGIVTTSFKENENITFRFVIKNNTGKTIKWKLLDDQKLNIGLLPTLKRDGLLFDVFQDSTYKFIGKPYESFLTTTTARPYEEIAANSSVELRMNWQGEQKDYKAFPNYGFIFTKNSYLPKGHYVTGVAKAIEIDGTSQQIYLIQNFSVN